MEFHVGLRNLTHWLISTQDAWQAPKKKGEFLFICVGACAQHVPVALCDRLAPGGLLVVPVVATGTRRQAYLMVRRDLRGRLLAPRTVCEASFVPLIDTRDFAPDCVEIKNFTARSR